MSLSYMLAATAGLIVIATLPAVAVEPAEPHDRCAYMNHDSKAYAFCMAEQAAAQQRTNAAPLAAPKPEPKPQPK